MPLKFDINAAYHRVLAYVQRRAGFEPPEFTIEFIPDITRYFLSAAIEYRIKFLVSSAGGEEQTLRNLVTKEYQDRVKAAIRQELTAESKTPWKHFKEVAENLDDIKLPVGLSPDVFATRESFITFMRGRMIFFPGRFEPYEALAATGIFLRAIQQVSLGILRDYPATNSNAVLEFGREIVRGIIEHIDNLQQMLQTPIELKSRTQIETQLRVLVARAKGTVCLPLRPIPTAPLSSDEMSRYVGRPEEEARKLAHQIRHADGTILVSGYRGVGKSSFVNRVIFHARATQKGIPSDGWLIVPITMNLAKVAGVQNILRLTLRSVRDALLDSDSRSPKPIPGHLKATPLPLSRENEIEPLEEAYIRATYKVTMSRSAGSERRSDIGTSISIDPGKWFGGRIVGVELGKFIEAGIKKTKTEKINRELSLLDFDENAAEDSLGRLIRSLATPRPIVPGGPKVRIKLVFVFDELDKMDVETGLKPMIEGLKNLFLQQYSVFILVTSKGFYYELLKQRSIEDAMLSSYFSAVVHIPLLSYKEALKIVKDWVDLNASEQSELLPVEVKLLEQLTGALVYHSFGNPRDIIRELRLMQDWADTPDQPFLTDALSTPKLQIFSAIQDCIEKTILPQQQTSSVTTAPDGSMMLVAERLASDEARLEQARRGLYILTEELIDQQTLYLEPAPSTDKAAVLERIHRDNFSLFPLEEVRQLAKVLAGYLKLLHNNADLFSSNDWGGSARPLFNLQGSDLQVTPDFYRLTGRQAGAATAEPAGASNQTKTVEELRRDAEAFAASPDWSVKWAAINIIKRLGADNLTLGLKQFLWDVVRTDPDESHRLAAAERLPTKIDFEDEIKTITELLAKETNERIVSILIHLLSGASTEETRESATDTLVGLLLRDAESVVAKATDSNIIDALTVLQTVASDDVTLPVLEWLNVRGENELVLTTAISLLKKNSVQHGIDLGDTIISNNNFLGFFTTGLPESRRAFDLDRPQRQIDILKTFLVELVRSNPLASAPKLLRADETINVNALLISIWDLSFGPKTREASSFVFEQILDSSAPAIMHTRLQDSLRSTPEFQARILPSLRKELSEMVKEKRFTADQAKTIEATLSTFEVMPEPGPPKPEPNDQSIITAGAWGYIPRKRKMQ